MGWDGIGSGVMGWDGLCCAMPCCPVMSCFRFVQIVSCPRLFFDLNFVPPFCFLLFFGCCCGDNLILPLDEARLQLYLFLRVPFSRPFFGLFGVIE